MARKLVRLNIKETSGVDHPAHLHEGWVVMKSASPADASAVLDELRSPEVLDEAGVVENTAKSLTAVEAGNEALVDTTNSASAELENLTFFQKEEIMSDISTDEVVIIPETASEAEIIKAMPATIRKMLSDASATAEEALRKAAASESALIAERDARADEAAVIKASKWSHLNLDPTVVGPALRRVAESDSALAGEIVKALDSANALVETNVVFNEVGTDAPVSTDDAYSAMESLAKAAVAEGTAPSFESALMSVAQSNPDLYSKYLNEKGR